jgi:HSP20 family protein
VRGKEVEMFDLVRRDRNPVVTPGFPILRDLDDMGERIGQLLGPRVQSMVTAEWLPPIDIQETEKAYVFKAELPEIRKEEVKVTLQDGVLTIQGERKQEKEEKGKKFLRLERSYGSFLRTFTMPADADATRVTAEFKDGVLHIQVPKSEKPPQKSIEIKFA